MLEDLPGSLRRVLALRQFAPLGGVDVAELAMVAENVVETTLLAGNRIVAPGARMPGLHLIIDGRIEYGGDCWGPRDVFGLLEVLAGTRAAAPAIAAVDTRVLRITAGDTREILEDNFGLLRAMLRELATRTLVHQRGFRGGALSAPTGARLTLVERLLVLRQHSPLAGARLQALTAVAQLAEERRWRAGDSLFAAGAPADTMHLVLEGSLRAGDAILGPGDTAGVLEAFAGISHDTEGAAASSTSTLSLSVGALVDVLEDHPDLGLAMITTLSRRLLEITRAPN